MATTTRAIPVTQASVRQRMALNLESAQRLFRLGRYVDLLAEVGAYRKLLPSLPVEYRILIAQTLQHTGQITAACDIAERENHSSAPPAIRSKCEVIIGIACRQSANVASALSHFHTAVQLAKQGKDTTQLAWAALHTFRLRAELQRAEDVASILPEVRKYVLQAADPHVTAYMHDAVALMEASSGRLEEARRHLDISSTLIDDHPNASLEQINHVASSYVSFHECRYRDALRSLERARQLLPIVGGSQEAAINCNLGHALMTTGKLSAARERFAEVVSSSTGLARLGALDGLARAHLVAGDLEECEATIAKIESLFTADQQLSSALAGRWAAVTRAQLLLRLGLPERAAQEISTRLIGRSGPEDRILACNLTCLYAEALAGTRDGAGAIRALMAEAFADPPHGRGELASFLKAAGVVLASFESPMCQTMLNRARRIWVEQGNTLASNEIDAAPKFPGEPESSARLTNAIANSLNLGYSPKLLATELMDAARALSCADGMRLVANKPSTAVPQADKGQLTLFLGQNDGRSYTLTSDIPTDPTRALLLADVYNIGRAALELERRRSEERNRAALWPAERFEDNQDALFVAEEMQTLLATARRVAATGVPVLITGETGTGKEILARTIHAGSNRAKRPFLPFNCSSTPRDMLDSQLFGHRRGAFTGATDSFQGVIRAASEGTLFLDEIGDMGLDVQPKLLRFLESAEIHPLGEAQPVHVDVRVIAATNAPLDTLVAEGRFREDLFYRLNIVRLHVPPLRERRVEIPALAAHYLAKHANEFAKGDLRLAEETMEYLVLYRWPGNVRQLANEMRRMAALAERGAVLMPEHLSPAIAASRRTVPASERSLDSTEVVVRLDQPMAAAVQHLERAMVQYALRQCGGRLEETAAVLGLSRKGLYLKRQRFGIDDDGSTPP